MEEYIKNLILQGESQTLDFKFEVTDAKKLAKTFSAFANTDGGTLLIGVKDNGKITGVSVEEEEYMLESAACIFCKPSVKYNINKWFIEGKWILEVIVPPSRKKPHYALNENNKWRAYIRVKDKNIQANGLILKVWKNKKNKKGTFIRYGILERQVLKTVESNPKTFNEIKNILNIKGKTLEQILVKMISIDAIKITYDQNDFYYSSTE